MKKLINKSISCRWAILLGLALASASNAVAQTVLFSDTFDTANSATNWVVFGGANAADGNATNDYKVVFATNYTTIPYRFNSVVKYIPPAPHSTTNTARGLYVTANKNTPPPGSGRQAGVSLYPIGKTFTNNYALRFDLWMDYVGDTPGGGTGSTEFATFGLNHTATRANWGLTGSTAGDGIWFAIDGEAGTTRDYRTYTGPAGLEVQGAAGGFYDRNGDGFIDQTPDYLDATQSNPFWDALPAPPGQSPAGVGKQWVTVEVKQVNNYITWSVNGYTFASGYSDGTTSPSLGTVAATNGAIMIGYSDPVNGVAAQYVGTNENYAIFDNVQVVDLGTNPPVPVVSIHPTKTDASKPGGGSSTYGIFTLNLNDVFGNPVTSTKPVLVSLAISGTASNGLDYTAIPTTFTIPANVTSADINIIPTSRIANPSDTVFIKLTGSTNYDLRTSTYSSLTITDPRGVPSADLDAYKPVAYEKYHPGLVNVTMASPSSADVTIHYSVSGTATSNVHYVTLPGTVVIPANTTNAYIAVTPINNSLVESNRTVTITLTSGTGYRFGTVTNATITLRSDDLTSTGVLFSDNLDSDTSANWIINKTDPTDLVTWNYDYSADGIPSAPGSTNSTTRGVKLQPDFSSGFPAGISLSPKGGNFTGDYRVRFDAWVNYDGDPNVNQTTGATLGLPGGGPNSTENLITGVGTTGNHAQGTTNVTSDGIWFRVNSDGSSTVADDYGAFRAGTELDGVYVSSQSGFSPYFSEFGMEPAPAVQVNLYPEQVNLTYRGCIAFAWHDVTVTKQGTNVTWAIDNLPIAVVPFTNGTLSTNVFVGYTDPATGSDKPEVAFCIIDNFRVESLAVAVTSAPVVVSVQSSGTNILVNFTGDVSDTPASFKLQSAAVVNTGYADDAAAVITQLAPGSFRATIGRNGAARFYRVRR